MSEKTIRVRIRVGVDAEGMWHACGWHAAHQRDLEESAKYMLEHPIRWCWVEADAPMPELSETVVLGSVGHE